MTHLSREQLVTRLKGHAPRELGQVGTVAWAAVAVIWRACGDGDWELLFIKRAAHDLDPWSGHMAFPGGRVDPEDATPLAAAIRETWEELSVDLSATATFLGQLNDVHAISRGGPIPLIIRPFAFVLDKPIAPKPNEAEVDAVVWIRLSLLRSKEARGVLDYAHDGQALTLPCIRYDAYTIWGLTHHMVRELFDVLRALPSDA